jgi:hypothetical protein
MKLEVLRFADNGDTTLGILLVDGVFECFTVEDEERKGDKVKGETRVPNGTYDVDLRAEGGYHNRYTSKYGSMHKGMLCIHNAPNWKIDAYKDLYPKVEKVLTDGENVTIEYKDIEYGK